MYYNWKFQYLKWKFHWMGFKKQIRNVRRMNQWASRHIQFSSDQSLIRVRLFATSWITAHQASLSNTKSWSSPKLMSIESVMPSSHLILCHPLLFLPPIPSSIRVFSNESTLCMRWPKYWSFSFSIQMPSIGTLDGTLPSGPKSLKVKYQAFSHNGLIGLEEPTPASPPVTDNHHGAGAKGAARCGR